MEWHKRLFPRNSARTELMDPGVVVAYYWNGGRSFAQPVREIDASGCFVVTAERWYLGTTVRLTLQAVSVGNADSLCSQESVCVEGVVIRHDEDGVELVFVQDESCEESRPKLGKACPGLEKKIRTFLSKIEA